MRELARALKADARDLENVATGMRSAVGAMEFEGPAAERFQQKTRPRIEGLRDLADRLAEVARVLLEAADELDGGRRRRDEVETAGELVPGIAAFWSP
jgi:hypothetical protein